MPDREHNVAAHSGAKLRQWAGHRMGKGYVACGDMLAGPQVLEQTAAAYAELPTPSFAERMIAAMQAGEAAGGDKRGKQGAALLIYTTEDYAWLDLRVDDHADPLGELRRLFVKSLDRFQPFVSCLPSRRRPAGITDRNEIETIVTNFQLAQQPVRS